MQLFILTEDRTQRKIRVCCRNLLWHNNRHLLLGRSASPVLANDNNRVFARFQRLGEVAKAAVGIDPGHWLSIDNQCSTWLSFAEEIGRSEEHTSELQSPY